ncbi:helix-turn-helix domain-containing protein [Synergistaceae bacterium OttesenSCG-928-I11]|nr:helix-turn-helix domain-containing protein [Synergistaceae bacterium OttesenSCG-928-I11]
MNKKIAQKIAESAHEVIGYDVLVTDAEGTIIGSNRTARVGRLHAPSLAVLKSGKPSDTTREEAASLDGVKPGYTVPIVIPGAQAAAVGTISIAGPPARVQRYGLLVQKQAEILLQEQALMEMNLRREQAVNDLASGIVHHTTSQEDADAMAIRATSLGYAPHRWRVAVVLETDCPPGTSSTGDRLRRMQAVLENDALVARLHPSEIVAFLTDRDEAGIRSSCERLIDALDDIGCAARAGVGPPASNLVALGKSAASARDALIVGIPENNGEREKKIFFADELRLEILLHTLPSGARTAYVHNVLAALSATDRDDELVQTFVAWCGSPFQPSSVAHALSVHRNTLQYRLKKIRELTGLDPWRFRDAFTLWSAIRLRGNDSSS